MNSVQMIDMFCSRM